MKTIYNKFIPFKGFWAITILCWIFIRNEYKYLEETVSYKIMLNHESIHFEQEKELGFIFFYILYLIEWIIKCIISLFTGFKVKAYRSISFEQEASNFESTSEYLKVRKHYRWLKYIFKLVR